MTRAQILKVFAGLVLLAPLLGAFLVPALGTRILIDSQAQSCLPWDVYWVSHTQHQHWRVGDLAVFDAPQFKVIDPRDDQPKLKMVAAVAGDRVVVRDNALWINGKYWGKFWLSSWLAKASPDTQAPWFSRGASVAGSWIVPAGHVLLLGTEPLSFDGRYWGFIAQSKLAIRATPL